ncbi:hypothetical protein [Streptosporangium subroseum]|uniref:hypothetical protein n=1 Tax=Streptosporangium subroseum TaxID=106412 RepID=UPI00308ED899|nr:hypothetical protein OHB15_08300 [Streptosporangium subroseum]
MHALRLLRAAVFAVVCVTASMAMHVLAQGAPVAPGVLAGAMPPVAVGAFFLARRQRGFGALMGASFATQYGLHLWFSAGMAPPQLEHPHGGGLSVGLFMLLVHVATGLLSAYWLERGESGLAILLRLLVASVLTLLVWRAPAIAHPVAPPARGDDRVSFVTRLLAAAVSRRGPPGAFSVI